MADSRGCALLLAFAFLASATSRVSAQNAEALFRASASAYREGEYLRAAALLERAYELDPEPILLYNLARALDRAGERDAAREAYERYLDKAPAEARERELARRRIEELAILLEAESRPVTIVVSPRDTSPPASEPSAPSAVRRRPWGGVLTLSLGGAALGLGVAFGVRARQRSSDATAASSHADGVPQAREARRLGRAGTALLVSGAALASAGLLWVVLGSRREPRVAAGPATLRIRF